MSLTQAVILAGGKGERLRPLTNDRPKPMVEINGHPFLEYLIALLKRNGIQEVILLLGYLPEKVVDYFGDGSKFGIRIRYHIRPVEYNNGTRVREASALFEERFIVLYGDVYWQMDLSRMLDAYHALGTPAMMTIYNNANGDGEYPKGNIVVSPESMVISYKEFDENPLAQWLDIGFCILEKVTLSGMPEGDFEFQKGFLRTLIARRLLGAFKTDSPYATITNPALLKTVEERFGSWGVKI